ncbi:MAG: glycosyl hydrolase [Bacillota bacterium]
MRDITRDRMMARFLAVIVAIVALRVPAWSAPVPDRTATAAVPHATGGFTVYQDGAPLESGSPDFSRDVKTIERLGTAQRLINYPAGYQVDLPPDAEMNFRYSPAYVRASSPALDIKISRERSPYGDVEMYLRDYPNRFIAREDYAFYRQVNDIRLIDDTWLESSGRRIRFISFRRQPAAGSPEAQNEYALAYIVTPGRQEFYALFFRTDSLDEQRPAILGILESFTPVERRGTERFNLDLHPVPGRWNQETRALYDRLSSGGRFMWGIFYPWAVTRPEAYQRVASIEGRLGFRFPVVLHYLYVGSDFPTEGMRNAFERGQLIELTMQVATLDNGNANLRNANFDLLDGRLDEAIRRFARGAKEFGHPFLFRLNNEMNTDWAQYSGVCTLNDVDIYTKVWCRIYRIFDEEGVDNAIWVFNPNGRNYPPMNWNRGVCYYPGNGFVHLIGLTGYNTGDYYYSVTREHWVSFRQIYDPIVAECRKLYARFPWLITEFACSSVGGDKAQWIDDMFAALPGYPEIRGAVWWSYADFDYRPGREGTPARRYWLDEKDEYLDAFREGLRRQGLLEQTAKIEQAGQTEQTDEGSRGSD